MTEMYGSYSDEDLNEWERMPQSIRVLTSSAFGAWLLRRDKRIKEQETKTWQWREVYAESDGSNSWIEFTCPKCKDTFGIESGQYGWHYGDPIPWKACPVCGAKMSEIPTGSESEG